MEECSFGWSAFAGDVLQTNASQSGPTCAGLDDSNLVLSFLATGTANQGTEQPPAVVVSCWIGKTSRKS